MIGVAQTFGQAFVAWVPVVILNVGKYAPHFHMGFSVMSGISVLQFAMIFVLRYFVNRQTEQEDLLKREVEADRNFDAKGESASEHDCKSAEGTPPVQEIVQVHNGKR